MLRQQNLFLEISHDFLSSRLGQALLLAATLFLLLTASPSAEAQGSCQPFGRAGDNYAYFRAPSGFVRGSISLYFNNSCSPPASGSFGLGSSGAAYTGSRSSAISICNRGNGRNNDANYLRSGFWGCRPLSGGSSSRSGGGSGGGSGSGGGGSYDAPAPEISPTQLPLGNVRVSAALGPDSGIQFQRFDHYAVGAKSVADMGILDVVDVWGNANQYFEVCFPDAGLVVFLDAATSPRSVVHIDNFKKDGYTCGAMDRAGTMVLVKTSSGSSTKSSADAALAQRFIESTKDAVDSATDLRSCIVTPEHNLNMREAPWGEIITVVREGAALAATARTRSWFKVTLVDDNAADQSSATREGWIAAWHSTAEGACDWTGDDEDSPALASAGFLAEDEQPAFF